MMDSYWMKPSCLACSPPYSVEKSIEYVGIVDPLNRPTADPLNHHVSAQHLVFLDLVSCNPVAILCFDKQNVREIAVLVERTDDALIDLERGACFVEHIRHISSAFLPSPYPLVLHIANRKCGFWRCCPPLSYARTSEEAD